MRAEEVELLWVRRSLDLYHRQVLFFGQAAKFAGVSVWKFSDLLKEHHIPLSFDLEELEQELKGMR